MASIASISIAMLYDSPFLTGMHISHWSLVQVKRVVTSYPLSIMYVELYIRSTSKEPVCSIETKGARKQHKRENVTSENRKGISGLSVCLACMAYSESWPVLRVAYLESYLFMTVMRIHINSIGNIGK
jgi:hypothetical protein